MAKHKFNMNGNPFVVIADGYLNLYTHDGHLVNSNLFIRVSDSMEGPNYVIAKFTCNIAGSIEEMQEQIKEWNLIYGDVRNAATAITNE